MQADRPGEILIVDDDPAFLPFACAALTRSRHAVTSCSSGDEARYQMHRGNFDVILCAEKLPDEDGLELCRFIKADPDLQACSVGMIVDATPTSANPDANAEDERIFEAVFNLERAGMLDGPDDVIPRASRVRELLLRTQSLLRLRRYLLEMQNYVGTMMTIAEGVEEQDRRARGHCKRLSLLAVELGAVLGCDEWQLATLERGGYLHDIGKVSIPGAILQKAQSLSPREMQIIKAHPALGERLCRPVGSLSAVVPIIRHHHERVNGTGYPDGLQGEEIPLIAQIFTVADVYESLRSWRPYRAPLGETHALETMRREVDDGYWNADVYRALVRHVLPGLDKRLDALHLLWPQT
jgi:putative two-component system response regulator